MPDAIFEDPRLAAIYDTIDGERDDLDHYESIADELDARSVLDVGCGTGSLAVRLAGRGLQVVGLDPAGASLAIARAKPNADRVTWVHGTVADLPPLQADLAVMTGNVAQVFLADHEWDAALTGIRSALRPGGHLVFETRDPAREAWRGWTREQSYGIDGTIAGDVERWVELLAVDGELVSFRWTFRFLVDGDTVTSESTIRFRPRPSVEQSLVDAGYDLIDVRDAPDRPGLELVFIARRAD